MDLPNKNDVPGAPDTLGSLVSNPKFTGWNGDSPLGWVVDGADVTERVNNMGLDISSEGIASVLKVTRYSYGSVYVKQDVADYALDELKESGTGLKFSFYAMAASSTPVFGYAMITYYYNVQQPPGGGCPFVAVSRGDHYDLLNNILPQSEYFNGSRFVTDGLFLEGVGSSRFIRLKVLEFEREISFIRGISLFRFDRPEGGVAQLPSGRFVVWDSGDVYLPVYVNSSYGFVTDRFYWVGDDYFEGSSGDVLVAKFNVLDLRDKLLVLRTDWKLPLSLKVYVLSGFGDWLLVGDLHPRRFWSWQAVDLSFVSHFVSGLNATFVKIVFTDRHRVDAMFIASKVGFLSGGKRLLLYDAYHNRRGDVRGRLLSHRLVDVAPGDEVYLTFYDPDFDGGDYVYVLMVDGRYRSLSDDEFLQYADRVAKVDPSYTKVSGPIELVHGEWRPVVVYLEDFPDTTYEVKVSIELHSNDGGYTAYIDYAFAEYAYTFSQSTEHGISKVYISLSEKNINLDTTSDNVGEVVLDVVFGFISTDDSYHAEGVSVYAFRHDAEGYEEDGSLKFRSSSITVYDYEGNATYSYRYYYDLKKQNANEFAFFQDFLQLGSIASSVASLITSGSTSLAFGIVSTELGIISYIYNKNYIPSEYIDELGSTIDDNEVYIQLPNTIYSTKTGALMFRLDWEYNMFNPNVPYLELYCSVYITNSNIYEPHHYQIVIQD